MYKITKIEKELDTFIKDGLTGGFFFDEECALELEEIKEKLKLILKEEKEKSFLEGFEKATKI